MSRSSSVTHSQHQNVLPKYMGLCNNRQNPLKLWAKINPSFLKLFLSSIWSQWWWNWLYTYQNINKLNWLNKWVSKLKCRKRWKIYLWWNIFWLNSYKKQFNWFINMHQCIYISSNNSY
jgi:hypothetical protein